MDERAKDFFNRLRPIDNFLGINGQHGSLMKEYGFIYCRASYEWKDIEKVKGQYDFTQYDSLVSDCRQNDQIPVITFCYNNPLYSGSAGIIDDTTKTAFLNYCKAAIDHFKNEEQFILFEFWNEPNGTWSNETNELATIQYTGICEEIYNYLKGDAPNHKLIAPVTNESNTNMNTHFLEKCCALGILDFLDYVCFHAYTLGEPENLLQYFDKVTNIISAYANKEIPLILGETGYSTTKSNIAEDQKAIYLTRTILFSLMYGLKSVWIYSAVTDRQDTQNGEDWYGIFQDDGSGGLTPLPSAIAIKELVNNLKGYYYIGRLNTSKDDYILLFINVNFEYKIAYWTATTQHTIYVDTIALNLESQVKMSSVENQKFNLYKQSRVYTGLPVQNSEVFNDYNNNIALPAKAHAEGQGTTANSAGHAEGSWTVAVGGDCLKISSINGNAVTIDNIPASAIVNSLVVMKIPNSKSILNYITAIDNANKTITLAQIVPTNTTYIIILNDNYSSSATGIDSVSTGRASHAGGQLCLATGSSSTAQGNQSIASGNFALANGLWCHATAVSSYAFGENTTADQQYGFAIGVHNKSLNQNDFFVIGNGNADSPGNAFRVTKDGKTYGLSAFNSTGADYAEYFEWLDGNINKEDRVGYFVTLEGEKIRKCTSSDSYILGIISAAPAIIGDSCQDDWKEKYVMDNWGRIQYHEVSVKEIKDSEGNIIVSAHTEMQPQINSNWDNSKEYISRESRPEWSTVGMLGKLLVRDDGTCAENGFCKSNDSGIATKSNTGYRVLKRVSSNIIMILFK